MWTVTIMNDANSPYYFTDGGVLQQFLSQQVGKILSVQQYDVILRSTTVYGLVDDPAIPSAPNPTINIVEYTQNYYKRA